jgi:hypothetical protein
MRRALEVLGFVLMLAVGFVYAAAGLVVPTPALFGLWVLWFAFVAVQISLRRRLWAVLSIPAIALVALIAIASLGRALLGWTA